MKKMMALFILLSASLAYADKWKDTTTGISWFYSNISAKLRIDGISQASGDVTIPSQIFLLPVTQLGYEAFNGYADITSITIPESITDLGYATFRNCSGLARVTIPKSVTNICYACFAHCSGLTSIDLPSSIVSIDSWAYSDCTALDTVTLPYGLTKISSWAFCRCTSLSSITIPAAVETIGDHAFVECSNLTTVEFQGRPPSGLCAACISPTAEIRYNVSYESEWLAAIKECGFTNATPYELFLPDGGPYFAYANGLKWKYTVKSGYVIIGDGSYNYPAIPKTTSGVISIPEMLGGQRVTKIGAYALCNCNRITGAKIPTSVTSIDNYAFSGCCAMTSVMIPWSVTELGQGAFEYCALLKSLSLPSIQSAKYGVFFSDSNLKHATLAQGTTIIGRSMFNGCSNLESITIPSTVTNIGESAFARCSKLKQIFFDACDEERIRDMLTSSGFSTSEIEFVEIPHNNYTTIVVTNVVAHYIVNSIRPNKAIPASMDTGFVNIITEIKSGGAVSVPESWASNYPDFTKKFGSNFTSALMKQTGKTDGAENAMLVWQDYVAGTDPTKEDDVFRACITMVDGKPVISFTPEFEDAAEASKRKYTSWGKVKLQDSDWVEIPAGRESDYNFFKVTVEMK